MSQIQFLESVVRENLDNVNKYLIRANRSQKQSGGVEEPTVFAIQTETIHFAAKTNVVHRIFVQGRDFPLYRTVGWLLYNDVEYCLICNVAFGFFCYKYYCWSCGNIVCSACSPYCVIVSEIAELGTKRVCVQCCWGQDIVTAVHTYKDPNAPAYNSQPTNGMLNGGNNGGQVNLLEKATSHVSATTPSSMKSSNSHFHKGSNNHPETEQRQIPYHSGSVSSNNISANSSLNSSFTAPSSLQRAPSNTPANTDRESFSSTTSTSSRQQRSRPSLIITGGLAIGYLLVTPTPGFVIKTWRTDNKAKVFVNITSHASIPYNPDETQADKEVYKIIGDLKLTDDKDGAQCSCFDVIVHPNEIRFCDIDSRSRMRLCSQSLIAIQHLFAVPLDPAFKTLKLVSNYKGDEITLAFVPKPEMYNVQNFAAAMAATVALYKQTSPAMALREANNAIAAAGSSTPKSGGSTGPIKATVSLATASCPLSASTATSSSANPSSGNVGIAAESPVRLTPTPGFVIKTKDVDGNKVFINLCHHDTIPVYMPASSALSSLTAAITINLTRPPCFLFGPTSVVSDKDGGDCLVIACLVNSDSYQALDKHVPGLQEYPQTIKFCSALIKKWNEENPHLITLDDEKFTFPKTKYGFKGDGDVMGSMSVVIPSNSPSGIAGAAGSGSSSSSVLQGVNPMRLGKQLSSLSLASTSASSSSKNTSIPLTAALVASGAVADGGDLPFNIPESNLVSLAAIFVRPEPGFVVSARKTSGQLVYINICHSDSVGEVLPNQQPTHNRQQPYVPLILGSVGLMTTTYSATDAANMKPNKSLVLDVCVNSLEYSHAIGTLEAKDELAISVLEVVGRLGLELEDEFDIAVSMGAYCSPHVILGTCPVFATPTATTGTNSPQLEEKLENPSVFFNVIADSACSIGAQRSGQQQVPLFSGELWKRGHGVKSWKRRKFQFCGRRIKYFEKNVFKGDFDVKDCRIEVPKLSESGSPTAFQFILHSNLTKGASLICCADSDDLREQWIRIIATQLKSLSASVACMSCPPVRAGFLRKQGHVIRNWQRRYFVLDMGILRYYEKCATSADDSSSNASNPLTKKRRSLATIKTVLKGENMKGQLSLAGTTIQLNGSDRLYLSEGKDGSKDMLLQIEDSDAELCKLWMKDIQLHIDFANEHVHLADVQSV